MATIGPETQRLAKELVALDGNVTKSIVRAGEHYGAKVPKK